MLLLWLWLVAVAAQSAPAPPVVLDCELGVRHRWDSPLRYTCLWQSPLELQYRTSPNISTTGTAPTLRWFINQRLVQTSTQRAGKQSLPGVLPDSTITLKYHSAACPNCHYQNVTVRITQLRILFFILHPNRAKVLFQDVELAWCANLISTMWIYSVTCNGGTPNSTTLSSSKVAQIDSGSYPKGKEAACSQDYHYVFKVQYSQVGIYSCNLDVINGPPSSHQVSFEVKAAMLHLLSAQSPTIHQRLRLVIPWRLWAKDDILSYQLAANPASQSSWTLSYHPNAIACVLCPCTWPRRNECITQVLLKVSKMALRTITGTITFHRGTVHFVHHGRLISLTPNATMLGTAFYYISSSNQLYYSKIDAPPGSHRHLLFIRATEISHLFLIDYSSPKEYTLTIQLYLNLKGTIYNSLNDLNVSLSLFNSGPTDVGLMVNVVWFIPLQHPAMQCAWRFELTVGTMVTLHDYSQQVVDAQSYIPDIQLTFDPKLYSGFLVRVTCSTAGEMVLYLQASLGSYNPAMQNSVLFCSLAHCRLPLPTIQSPPPPDTTIRTTRSSHLNVYGNAGLNCDNIVSVAVSWNIYAVADNYSKPNWVHSVPLLPSVRTSTATLHLPALSLDYGFYHFVFNVTISTADPALPYLNNSCHAVVEVTKSELVAVIAGGSYRSVSVEDTVELDASMSADPDSLDPHLGLNISWYCTMKFSDYNTMTLSNNQYCHPGNPGLKWNSATPDTLVIPPHLLILKKHFYFRVVIQKDTRTSYFDQTISVLHGFVPQMLINCIENCQKTLIPTDRFTLNGTCSNCPVSSELKYHWRLLSGNAVSEVSFNWASDSSTGNSLSHVSFNPFSFVHFTEGWYTLELRVTTSSGADSLTRYNFYINLPPKSGHCIITPKHGWALQTKFTLICLKFQDRDLPLSYKATAQTYYPTGHIDSLKHNLLGTIVYFGYKPKSPPFLLPVGSVSGHHFLVIVVLVFDGHGTYTRVNLKVKVYDHPVDLNQTSMVDQLSGFVEGKMAPLTILLHETDYLKASQLLYEVASLLNSNSFTGREKAKVDKLRETLVNISASIPVTSPKLINQISASIFEAAQVKNQFNQQAQHLAATKLVELSSVLLNYSSEDMIFSESTEQLACSILTATSNVMAAFSSQFPSQGTEAGIPLTKEQKYVAADIFPSLRTLTEAVSRSKVPGQKDTLMQTKQWEITVKKSEKYKLEDSYLADLDCVNCIYPVITKGGGAIGSRQPVSSAVYRFEENPFPWLGKASHIATDVTGFHMSTLDSSGGVHSLAPKQIETFMTRRDIVSSKPIKLAKDPKRRGVIRGQIKIAINSIPFQEVFVQLTVDLDPIFTVSIYSGKGDAGQAPVQKHIVPQCYTALSLQKGHHVQDPYVIRIPTNLFQKNATDPKGSSYITIIVETEYSRPYLVINAGLNVSVFAVNCLTYQGMSHNWDSTDCTMGPLTNSRKIHCICNNVKGQIIKRALSLNFPWFLTASVLVLPEVIDLSEFEEQIGTLPRNLVTLITVLTIFLIYFLLLWWAWKKRESDKKKIIILPDNDPCDAACYLVTLYTGGRFDAGTTADVFLTLISKSVECEVRLLHHPEHQTFKRNSVDTFLLTTNDDLGELTLIRVWHNNVGHSPSWYLSRVKVQNVLTKQLWHFFCRKWLCTMKGDGLLHRTFSVTDPDVLLSRQDVFLIETSSKIEKEHLWFSVFAFNIDQSFTRIQRLSCCLAMLLSSLLLSIMLFQKEKHEDYKHRLIRSLVIGVESALVMVPVEMLISNLFIFAQRKNISLTIKEDPELDSNLTENHDSKPNNWKERLKDWYLMDKPASEAEESSKEVAETPDHDHYNRLSFLAGLENIQDPSTKGNDNCTIPQSVADQITKEESIEKVNRRKKKVTIKVKPMKQPRQLRPLRYKETQGRSVKSSKNVGLTNKSRVILSRCLLYLAWCLVWLLSAVSAVFIVLYGLSYGVETSWLWLMASVISFFQGVFLLQPLKIMAFSGLFALRRRRARDMSWSTGIQVLEINAAHLPKNDSDCLRSEAQVRKQYRPLEGDELILAKRKGAIRHRAFVFCRGFLLHLVFLGLLLYLVRSTDYKNSYYYYRIIQDKFSENLEQVNTVHEFYTWMDITFLPLIHEDANTAFLSYTNSKVLGLPRMRQVRSKQRSVDCFGQGIIMATILGKKRCLPLFDIRRQDMRNYNGSWEHPIGNVLVKDQLDYTGWVYETIDSPWFYHSRGVYHVYPLGGYSLYFSPKSLHNSTIRLLDLQNKSWIERSTWAVIIETTIYNVNVDLFSTVSLLLEPNPLGVVSKKLVVKPFTLRLFERGETNWIFISVLVILFFIIFGIDECMKMKRKGYSYFQKVKNIASLVMMVLLLMAIILYVAKFILSQHMLNFYKNHPNTFIAFHVISALDQQLRINVAFLIFVAVLKLLQYTRFLFDVRLAQNAIYVSFPAICSLILIIAVYSLIFLSFGYLLFGQFDKNFNTFIHAAQTVVSYQTGDFNDTEFPYNRIIGGIYMASFLFIMHCILLNLFESVVIWSYGDVRQFVHEKPSKEADVATFVVQECKRVWYSLWRKTPPKDGNKILTTLFYGRGSERTYGLKQKKVKGKKMSYLVI
ncbi:polycystin family receptor for egg jelly-like [Heterodontus francisci]|uniref:polycystin family receptor for egg jelly-like n=1 Tax=Heterodontus francisci TaxID=7792 RepID=UPI00355B0B74